MIFYNGFIESCPKFCLLFGVRSVYFLRYGPVSPCRESIGALQFVHCRVVVPIGRVPFRRLHCITLFPNNKDMINLYIIIFNYLIPVWVNVLSIDKLLSLLIWSKDWTSDSPSPCHSFPLKRCHHPLGCILIRMYDISIIYMGLLLVAPCTQNVHITSK